MSKVLFCLEYSGPTKCFESFKSGFSMDVVKMIWCFVVARALAFEITN